MFHSSGNLGTTEARSANRKRSQTDLPGQGCLPGAAEPSKRMEKKDRLTALDDDELSDWLTDVIADGSEGFLCALAEVALCADAEDYVVIRPALIELKRKYHARSVAPQS